MATSAPGTPTSGKSIYFDAPLPQFYTNDNMTAPADRPVTDSNIDVVRNPSVANPSITRDAGGAVPVVGTSQEKDAPEYTPPGPEEKLSRSYLPTGTKYPLSHSTKQTMDSSNTAEATTGPQSLESSHPGRATSMKSQSDVVRSPTSVSVGSGGSHRKDEGSTFANGAAVTGPNSQPEVDESVHNRAATAETALPAKTRTKLSKAERKEGKRLSKIIKSESKAEKQALATSMKELSELQAQQAQVIKREAEAHTAHTKALALHHKTESNFLKFKAEYEKNQLDMENMQRVLENERANARDVSERTAEKAREVEKLRVTRSADEREREAKLMELNQSKSTSRFLIWRS